MSAFTPHRIFTIEEASQAGEARRAAVALAQELGFDEVAAGRVALVATELATNLARHARGGQLLMAPRHDEGPAIEMLSLDHGPGMADVTDCLADGFSTGGTAGSGLGAVKRLADGFDIFSSVPEGTAIVAVVNKDRPAARRLATPAFRSGAVATCAPGEFVSGDGWAFAQQDGVASLLMADGLGHGPDAAAAAQVMLDHFETMPFEAPSRVIESAHAAMRSTRGAAVAMARLDAEAGSITFCGAGNIAGRVISGVDDRSLLSQHGTVGVQMRRLQDAVYAWPAHAMLVLHSDGIASRWKLDGLPGLLQCDPALIAGWLMRDHTRGRDDATVVVVQRG